MKRTYFAPDDFDITPDRLDWAMQTFHISEKEVRRQTDEWHDHEYKRAYSDWNRAWKRWFRQADKYGTLHRDRKLRIVEEVSDEQRRADILSFENDPLIKRSINRKTGER